jgi:hypothetical protein
VLPIDGDDYMSVLMKQVAEEPVPPSSHVPELPPGVDEAIAWLMKKDPAARPPNLMTAIRTLETAAETAGIQIVRGAVSAAWDVATPGPDALRAMTGMPNVRVSTPKGGTVAPAATAAPVPTAAPARRTSRVVIAGVIGALIAGVVVFALVVSGGGAAQEQAAPRAVASTPPPVVADVPPAGKPAPAPPPAPAAPPQPDTANTAAPAGGPANVTLSLVGAPDGSEVVRDGQVIATLPSPVTLPRGDAAVELVVRHGGYTPATLSLVPDHDREVKVNIHHAAAAGHGQAGSAHDSSGQTGAHDSHDIADPFHTP